MKSALFAGVEAGGTKILCALANEAGHVIAETRIPTTSPGETFGHINQFFAAARTTHGSIAAGGVASFGPLDLDVASDRYGCLTTTPKVGWPGFNMLGKFKEILGVPVAIDTDVNCAALAEGLYGAAQGLDRFCYMTVGTGVGVGCIESGHALPSHSHAEIGHVRVTRATGDDFVGICPYHHDCAEGLACGPAMKARWGMSAEDLPADHEGWEYEAHYIAAVCANLTYTMRPQRIIIGGGVLERSSLYQGIHAAYRNLTAGYALDRCSGDAQSYIVAPALSQPSPGLMGAIELARRKLSASQLTHHAI